MIRSVTGRTGEGKTCYAVRCLILDTLLRTNRVVVTNISLNIEPLAKYIEQQGAKFDRKQLILLPAEPNDTDVELYVIVYRSFEKDRTNIEVLPFDPLKFWEVTPKGALIVFDEAGEYFNALQVKRDASAILGSYARLHRHLEHDLYLMVQTFEHMSKQLRDLVHEQIVIYSLYQHPPPPLFIKINSFMIRHYDFGGTANPKAHKLYFRAYKTIYFSFYDSHQHSEYHKSIDRIEIEDKKTVKKSIISKIIEKITGNPLNLVYLAAGCFVIYGISTLSDFFKTTEQTTQENKPTRLPTSPKLPEKNENLFTNILPDSIEQGTDSKRPTARARAQTYKAISPRKYGLPTDQRTNDSE